MKSIVEVNSNFHHAAGADLFKKDDRRFREYRRKWERRPLEFKTGDFPLFIDIEVASACNLKCPFCATTFRNRAIKKGFMPETVLKKIIDEGADNNLYGVKFNIRGEPLLHPEIHKFVLYAKRQGLIDVYFNTNATLLDQEMSRKLIDAGLDRISVSFEGHTKEVYERNRVGAKYASVLKNIEGLQSLKKRQKVRHPKVRIQTVMLPEIAPFFGEFKDFWQDKVDEVAFLDYKEMKEKKKGISYPWACPQIWQRMAIWWDGSILPCNHDDDGLLTLGNVKTMSIKEAWNSKKLTKIRNFHIKGNAHKIKACDGCYLRDSEIAKIKEKKSL